MGPTIKTPLRGSSAAPGGKRNGACNPFQVKVTVAEAVVNLGNDCVVTKVRATGALAYLSELRTDVAR